MNVLILNRFRLQTNPYRAWLGDDVNLSLISSPGAFEPGEAERQSRDYDEVVVPEDYVNSWLVEHRAVEMHRRRAFDAVLAMSEGDILRGARLRRLMGLPGQDEASALAYRDKATMKQRLAAGGIPVVPFAPVENAADLIAFCAEQGFPVVVKPRRGAGSVGVTRIFGEDDLVAFLSGSDLLPKGDIPADLLAERCIVQEMLQVDGIATPDGVTCWPSAVSSNLEARFGRPIYNAMLDRDDPLFEPLRDLVRRTIEVLPTPENTIFHAEIFRDEAGRLLLNEIACRMGGGRNKDSLKAAFGVDLVELQVKAQLKGIPVGDALAEPARMCGWLLIPPARGRLLRIPGECPVAGIVDYRAEARPGDVLHGPTSCESRVASFIAAGATRAEVEAALRRAHDWFADAVAYGDAAEPATP